MQFTILTLTLLTILQLSSSAPTPIATNPTPPPPLQKRSHYGWIGSSNSTSCSSDTDLTGPRPKINDVACHPFVPAANYLAISFGSWPLGFGALDVFEDEECAVKIDTISAGGEGEGGCVDVKARGLGGMRGVKNAD